MESADEAIPSVKVSAKISEISNTDLVNCTSSSIRKGIWDIFKNMFGQSSFSGLSQLAKSPTNSRRCAWVVVFFICIGLCTYHSIRFVTSYMEYPVVVSLDVENNKELEFPAITVCNLNGVRRSALMFYGTVIPGNTLHKLMETSGIRKFIERTSFSRSRVYHSPRLMVSSSKRNRQDTSETYNNTRRFFSILQNLSERRRRQLGHQAMDLIIKCTWMGVKCSYRNFTISNSFLYGNCYTFNAAWSSTSTPKTTTSVGAISGLTVELNLQRNDYLEKITPKLGARVVIHSPFAAPQPENEGIDISPGLVTSVTISKVTTERLPAPYKDKCRNYEEQSQCFFQCLQELNMKMCKCVDPSLKLKKNAKICSLESNAQVSCMDDVVAGMMNKTLKCDCPLPCRETMYDMIISSSVWLINETKYKIDGQNAKVHNLLPARENFAKLSVFYKTLDHVVYRQQPKYRSDEIFSNLGGQLGIWLGVSLVAWFEVIEMIYLLVEYVVSSRIHQERK